MKRIAVLTTLFMLALVSTSLGQITLKGRVIDDTKLKNGEYKLGIVFSSSVDGAFFKGAVGSTLYVDEVELICED